MLRSERLAGHDLRLNGAGDAELARAAREGNVAAFERLYRSHISVVLGYTRAVSGSANEAEDVAADAFVRALERLDSFDPDRGSFRLWLLTIARNIAVDRLRARRAEPVEPSELERRLAQEPTADHHDAHLDARIVASINRLSPAQRQVIVLRDLIGVSTAECAEVLGKSAASIRQHRHMAIRALAEALGETSLDEFAA